MSSGTQQLRTGLLVFAVLSLVISLTAAFWNYTQDDVFITYVYSRNLIEGHGFVFNLGEKVQGTTTPLYTLLMAGIHLFTDDLLHAGNSLSAVFLLTAIWLGIRLAGEELSPLGRFGFGVLFASSPLVYVSFGMETLLYCCLLMFSLWLWAQNRRVGAMLVAAALTWTRADGVVLGGTLWLIALYEMVKPSVNKGGLILTWEGVKKLLGLGLVYAAGIAPWYVFAWAYFGSPLPNTFGAKQNFLGGLRWWGDGSTWLESFYGNNPIVYGLLILVLVGLWRVWHLPKLRPAAAWAVFYALGYTTLNTTAFWYYTPWVMILFWLAMFGGDALQLSLHASPLKPAYFLSAGLLLILVSGGLSVQRALDFATPPQRVNTYVVLGQWINQYTPSDATLLVGDLGIMGYHARRYTLDSPGLIVPEMVFKTDPYAVAKYKTDLVVGTGYYTWQQLTAQDWFKGYYLPLAQFSTAGDAFSPMTVYGRRHDLTISPIAYQGAAWAVSCEVQLPADEHLPIETHVRLYPVGADHESPIYEHTQPFLMGQYPEENTPAPETLQEQIILDLPTDLAVGTYEWEMDCAGELLTGNLEILPVAEAPEQQPINAEWGDFLRLESVNGGQAATWSGGAITLFWQWSVLATPDKDYSLFVHLVDATGRVWAQADGYLEDIPATLWSEGQPLIEQRDLLLPPDLPQGTYHINMGWYDAETDQRILLTDGQDGLILPLQVNNQWVGGTGLP